MPEARPNPGKAAGAGALQGLHVLVVEDEYLLAQELCHDLVSEGATIMGPVPRLDTALDMLDRGPPPSLAILDVCLQGRKVWPLADALTARQIPFVFVTGYDAEAIPEAYADLPRCSKPVDLAQLLQVLPCRPG
ncbi:response regulator [Paracoccus endophyticus]|uniref:response regulator n=1 Tax=Paracoccus endophyticus TaxID=2233774 RepID=UPI00197DBAC9|nr:response regulator [Paracoccus endophyticus]